MAILKTLGDWLKGSGWTQALTQADTAASGTADSFLRAAHVGKTRSAHQITAAALYFLQHKAYQHYSDAAVDTDGTPLKFEDWSEQRSTACPQFKY